MNEEYITPEQKRDIESVKAALDNFARAFSECVRFVVKVCNDVIKITLDMYPNKRVIHLAKHGKGLTKKKNIKRIIKWIEEQGKSLYKNTMRGTGAEWP